MIGQWTPCDKTDGRVKSFLGKSVFLIEQQGNQANIHLATPVLAILRT